MTVLDYRSPSTAATRVAPQPQPIGGYWLGWAVFLGMSWTWCIGMFLPVLIMREYGLPGWFVFAVPNVLGAAAMGWVLRDGRHAFSIAFAHEHMSGAFSLVTIAFHAFFLVWICLPILGASALLSVPLLAVALLVPIYYHDRSTMVVATAAFALACVLIVLGVERDELPYFYGVARQRDMKDFASLAGVCIFGFSLCPYLDRTFLHARQRTTVAGGRAAFTGGFGLFFLLMIVLTLLYSGWMNKFLDWSSGLYPAYLWPLIGLHLAGQSAFTCGIHWRRLREDGLSIWLATAFTTLSLALLGWTFLFFRDLLPHYGETIYRLFLSFYGLIFPAYVWLCMIPGRGRLVPNRRQWIVLSAAVLVAAPMYWMGFIEGKMFWLLPGVGVVLLARVFVRTPSSCTQGEGGGEGSSTTRRQNAPSPQPSP